MFPWKVEKIFIIPVNFKSPFLLLALIHPISASLHLCLIHRFSSARDVYIALSYISLIFILCLNSKLSNTKLKFYSELSSVGLRRRIMHTFSVTSAIGRTQKVDLIWFAKQNILDKSKDINFPLRTCSIINIQTVVQ